MAKFILKDQRGNDQLFEHDKIFVQGENGELVQFTEGEGDTPAVLQDKTITENGTYTADSGYDGLGSVTVEVAGSGGDSNGEPYVKMLMTYSDTTYSGKEAANKTRDISFNISKNAIVVAGWYRQAGSTTQVNKTYGVRLLVVDPMLTVKSAGGGLFKGTINYDDYGVFNSNDMGVMANAAMLETLDCAEGVTSIPMAVCSGQTFLRKVRFPSTLETINGSAFSNTTDVEFDFSACTSVPTLSSASALGTTGKGQVLKIPSALFSSWSTATNWSSWASQMVAV